MTTYFIPAKILGKDVHWFCEANRETCGYYKNMILMDDIGIAEIVNSKDNTEIDEQILNLEWEYRDHIIDKFFVDNIIEDMAKLHQIGKKSFGNRTGYVLPVSFTIELIEGDITIS